METPAQEATPSNVTPITPKAVVKKERPIKATYSSKPVAKKAAAPVKAASPKVGTKKGKGKKVEKIRKPGPAMQKLAAKIKLKFEPGECRVRGCNKKTVGLKWCPKHKKIIRKMQLKANNAVWHKRVKAGTADHHVVYKKHATVWALTHQDKALAKVKKGLSIIQTPKDFQKALSAVPKSVKKAVSSA